jgi:hypothetical protein
MRDGLLGWSVCNLVQLSTYAMSDPLSAQQRVNCQDTHPISPVEIWAFSSSGIAQRQKDKFFATFPLKTYNLGLLGAHECFEHNTMLTIPINCCNLGLPLANVDSLDGELWSVFSPLL